MLNNLIVPVLNRYDLLQRMLDSIDYPVKHLLIINNGNEYAELEIPETVWDWTLLDMPTNLGVAASWNLGIKSFPENPVWFFSSADTVYEPGALETLATADRDSITLTESFPHFQTFAIGENVVQTVGLFDESFYPIYFEDTDYLWRAEQYDISVIKKPVAVRHDNSSTIRSNQHYSERNKTTFANNGAYFETKKKTNQRNEGRWNLERVRTNSWQMY